MSIDTSTIHPDAVTLTADVRSIPREYIDAAREWTQAVHEQDGTLKLAQVLANRPQVSRDTTQRIREAACRLRLDYLGTGAHNIEAAELDALADWLDTHGGTR